MVQICSTPAGTFEFCEKIYCARTGCAVYQQRAECEAYCSTKCRNGMYYVCISINDTTCVAAYNMRYGSYACLPSSFPVWSIALIAFICMAIGMTVLIVFIRKDKAQKRIAKKAVHPQNGYTYQQIMHQMIFDTSGMVPYLDDSMHGEYQRYL